MLETLAVGVGWVAAGVGLLVAVWLPAELIYGFHLLWEDRQARREVDAFLRSEGWRAPRG